MITTISSLPPDIQKHFNPELLSLNPRCCDNSQTLYEIYIFIKEKLMKRAKSNPIRWEYCLKLEKEFLELYERAKIKEEELKEEKYHRTKEPYYCINLSDKRYEQIFIRLKFKRTRLGLLKKHMSNSKV